LKGSSFFEDPEGKWSANSLKEKQHNKNQGSQQKKRGSPRLHTTEKSVWATWGEKKEAYLQ